MENVCLVLITPVLQAMDENVSINVLPSKKWKMTVAALIVPFLQNHKKMELNVKQTYAMIDLNFKKMGHVNCVPFIAELKTMEKFVDQMSALKIKSSCKMEPVFPVQRIQNQLSMEKDVKA